MHQYGAGAKKVHPKQDNVLSANKFVGFVFLWKKEGSEKKASINS